MNTLWQALLGTPWWVYVLVIYFVKVGFDATKTRTVPFKTLFILPIVFTGLSIETLISSVEINYITLSAYFIALAIGASVGWILVRNQNFKIDKKRSLIQLPGSWLPLGIILGVFSAKYYFGYSLAVHPEKANDLSFAIMMLGVSGACTGLFIGRLACYISRKRRESHYSLS